MLTAIKKHKNLIINAISIGIFVLLALYLINNRNIFEVIKQITWGDFLLIASTDIAILLLNASLNHSVISRVSKKIKFSDSLLLQFANNFLNKLTSHTGILFRGVFLKGVYKLDLSRFLATIAGVYIISFSVNSVVGLISSGIIYQSSGLYNIAIIILLELTMLVTLTLMVVSPVIKNREGFIRRNLGKMLDGWRIIKTEPKMLLVFASITILITLVSALQQYFIFKSIGVSLSAPVVFYLASLSSLTILISLTPSGIGIREAVFAFSAQLVNIDIPVLLLSSLVLRVISFLTLFILGGISYYVLTKRLKDI
ncbi:MAG: lysylphosphatidylglycerol synthase transmembrane domain-containing protein [Brevefilum sp.]|nr:lysylphosphatidylglycerol synthase transmembrane domain-containing protein [Brevefilum sp.]